MLIGNVPLKKIILVGLAIVAIASLSILSVSYRRDRVATFLNPEQDCTSQGYHACQALIAIGFGRFCLSWARQ